MSLQVLESHIRYPMPNASFNVHNKSATVDDFRGISMSPVISKKFEHDGTLSANTDRRNYTHTD